MRQPTKQSEYSPAAEMANRSYASAPRGSAPGGAENRPPQQPQQPKQQKPKKQPIIRLIDLVRLAFFVFVLAVILLIFAFCGRRGEAGPMGLQGEPGIQGLQGEKGDKGDKGDTGATGAQGPQGIQGVAGATGPKGEKGEKGDQGPQGIQGEKGDKGDTGATGPRGSDGTDGEDGRDGKDGVGVQYVYLDDDMNVIVILTNGNKINAGSVMEDVPSEGFAFTYLNGTCGISGIGTCADGDVVLARSYLGYDVTEVCANALSGCYTIQTLTIPKDLLVKVHSDAFAFCENLTEVTLPVTTDFRDIVYDGGNSPFSGDLAIEKFNVTGTAPKNMPYWCSTDQQGALYFHVRGYNAYNAVNTYLLAYPAGSSATGYELPADVIGIAPGAFMGARNLESIVVAEGNKMFVSVDGVLYGKDNGQMALIAYPAGKKGAEYTLSSQAGGMNVTILNCEAFYGAKYLKKVMISKELATIAYAHKSVSLTSYTSIAEFAVDEGNTHFIAIDGMLYEKVPGKSEVVPVT